jgi:hypothetical protein
MGSVITFKRAPLPDPGGYDPEALAVELLKVRDVLLRAIEVLKDDPVPVRTVPPTRRPRRASRPARHVKGGAR